MNPDIFNKAKKALKDEKNLVRLVLIAMVVFSFINYLTTKEIQQNQKTIFVPLNQNTHFWVSSQNSSEEYLATIGLYVADLLQTITPSNVEARFAMLLDLVHSENYQEIKTQLKHKKDTIQRYSLNSYSFNPETTKINKDTQKIIIKGATTRWTTTGKKTPKTTTIIIGYKIYNSRFYIVAINE